MGFEPTALPHVDTGSIAIETLLESDNIKKAFRDDANQYKLGPAKVTITVRVAGFHPTEFESKVTCEVG